MLQATPSQSNLMMSELATNNAVWHIKYQDNTGPGEMKNEQRVVVQWF